ncbi:M23 family metallopeptidase [Gordonia sp. zg691]|uniref:M23 family metallopeptidase n=1 Tax=Gordonia jinghuaiqii TaxID=2758710 RepID=UPI0016625A39|nr:M23 family metallopeptidase [Gordonia jinghuaiqii]MBD0861256.1 M23 family metallopeptidase [Gordonia jinghuaiqii]
MPLFRSPPPYTTAIVAGLVVAALTASPGVTAGTAWARPPDYSAPLSPRPVVVTAFDAPAQRWQPGHRGVDLASAPGMPVLAAGAGRVRFEGNVAGRPVVSVQHPDGVITTYEPVEAGVEAGDHVSRGEVIGTVSAGHPGCPVLVCLHWGARRGSGRAAEYLDPLGLLGAVRVRLKPVGLEPVGPDP